MVAAQTGAWRGTGPRPTVKAALKHGEGQALALREGEAFCAPQQNASRPGGLSYKDIKNNGKKERQN